MRLSHGFRVLGFVCAALLLSACSGPAVLPRMDGPATVVPQGRAFHILLAESQAVGYRCPASSGGHTLTNVDRFAPQSASVTATEETFREALRRSAFAGVDSVRADSTVTITEFYGNVAVPRQISGADLRRSAEQEYERMLGWDRQYAGVLDARGDSVLVVNVVSPVLEARSALADQWIIPPPAGSPYVRTLAYSAETRTEYPLCNSSGS